MSKDKRKRIVALAAVQGNDFKTLELIRKIFAEAQMWCGQEGSVVVDVLVSELDAVRAAQLLKKAKRLAGKDIRFFPKPFLSGRIEPGYLADRNSSSLKPTFAPLLMKEDNTESGQDMR